ncbi:MAG: glycoside hydrolase family 2 protein [Verrucomicrobiota bacterium]
MDVVKMDLCGAWQLRECDVFSADAATACGDGGWMDVTVPNSVYCNLAETARFEIADVENNPEKHVWVADAHWVYRKTFDCPTDLLDRKRIELVFAGLDTVARTWLNGELLGETENMFIEHRFDAKVLLKPEGNELVVAFEPAREYGERKRKEHPIDAINTTRSFVRKGQYVHGWDWCPPLEGCGIWRTVSLEGVDKARIDSIHAHTLEIGDGWADLKLEVELDKVVDGELHCEYRLTQSHGGTKVDTDCSEGLRGLVSSCENHEVSGRLDFTKGEDKAGTTIRIENPQLWWPVGYGEASLQTLEVSLFDGDEVIDQTSERFGIRTVELDTTPDEHGHKYQLVVNGQPIYIKGANWVPATMFPGSLKTEDYRALIEAAVGANMNMLRVWGGGYYEDKAFYNICDELGVMVWQEFMFACAYYPDEPWFHELIREEAAQVIKQLRNHPCKMVWCGNNECDWIHYEFWSKNTPVFHGEKIYHELLPAQIDRHEPGAVYVPSSPIATRKGVNPNEPHSGDMHNWDVWNFQKPISEYLQPADKVNRLATEFGLHAVPDIESVKQFCPASELRIGSKGLDQHNYQEDNGRLYRYIGELFAMPRDLEEFCYLSQLVQARAIGMYCEYLRAHNHRNHGIMFWQYNDAVPCISWSAIDYYNRPKALMFYARRFFADVLVTAVPHVEELFNPDFLSPHREPRKVRKIVAVNDSAEPVNGTLVCSIAKPTGKTVDEMVHEVEIPAHSRFELDGLPGNFQRPEVANDCVLIMKLTAGGKVVAENSFLYVPDKHMVWPEPEIKKELVEQDGQKILKLTSNVFVKDLQISAGPDVRPSDNYFDMLPMCEYSVALKAADAAIDLDQIRLRCVQTAR